MLQSNRQTMVGDQPAEQAPARSQRFAEYDASGVDLSLLRWMLSLTPLERLAAMERNARDSLTLLEYGRQHRQAETRRNR